MLYNTYFICLTEYCAPVTDARHWRIARIITMLTTSNRSPTPLSIAPWNQSHKGESIMQPNAEWNSTFLMLERDRARSASWPGVSRYPRQDHWPICILSVPQWKDPVPSPWRTDTSVGLARSSMMHVFEVETKDYSLSLKKMFPHKVTSPQILWALYLLVTKCSGSKAILKQLSIRG